MAPRAGLQRNAGDGERGPAQLLACKKAAARPLARRAHANATRPQDTRTARAARAERRPGGPADAYKRDARLRCSQHTPNSREHATPRANRSPAFSPRSRRTRRSARSGRSRRRWPRTGPSPSGSACARATRSAGTRSGGTGAARSSAFSRVLKNVFVSL